MSADIRIDVVRTDGEITRLIGQSGIAVCSPAVDNAEVERSDPATVSVRCSNAVELAWNLATLLAVVRNLSPDAYDAAHELERYVDPGRPQLHRILPAQSEQRSAAGGDASTIEESASS